MGNTFRSVARLIRALVHCNLAWEAMVENEILPDSPKTKQKYDAVFAEKQKNKKNHEGGGRDGRRKPDIISIGTCEDCLLCIESVLGSEWKSKLKLMPSLGKAYEFMAEVLSSLLGVEVAPDDVVPRYFDQQGNQSFKATQKCLEQLTEKGVCLLDRYKTDIRPQQQQQQQQGVSCPAAAVSDHTDIQNDANKALAQSTAANDVCTMSKMDMRSQNRGAMNERPSTSNKDITYCDKGASKIEPTAGDAMNDDAHRDSVVQPLKKPRLLARPASLLPPQQSALTCAADAKVGGYSVKEEPKNTDTDVKEEFADEEWPSHLRLEPTPLAEMLNPTAFGLSDPELLAAGGNQKMHFDEACCCSVPRDLLGEQKTEVNFDLYKLLWSFDEESKVEGVADF